MRQVEREQRDPERDENAAGDAAAGDVTRNVLGYFWLLLQGW